MKFELTWYWNLLADGRQDLVLIVYDAHRMLRDLMKIEMSLLKGFILCSAGRLWRSWRSWL